MKNRRKSRPLDKTNLTVRDTVHVMRQLIKTQYFVVMISDFPDKRGCWQRFLSVMRQFVDEAELSQWFLKVESRYRKHCNALCWIPRDWERILIFVDVLAKTMLECEKAQAFYQQKQKNEGSDDLRMTVIMDIIPRSSLDYLERVGVISLLCDGSVVASLAQHREKRIKLSA